MVEKRSANYPQKTMAEYIDRELAMKEIELDAPEQVFYSRKDAIECVRYISAADVAPIRHGRWLYVDSDTEQFFLCNRCKKKEYWESNYCPYCGAKMDLEVSNA